jgi:hypothetical protein
VNPAPIYPFVPIYPFIPVPQIVPNYPPTVYPYWCAHNTCGGAVNPNVQVWNGTTVGFSALPTGSA